MIYKKEIQINPTDSVCLIGKRRFADASQNFSGKKKESPGFFRHFHLIFALLVIGAAAFSPHLVFAAQVTLTWDANPEADLAGYRLYVRQEGQSYTYESPAWQGSSTSCRINLADDTRSYMVVRAFNTSGQESADSNEIMYDPAAAQGGESDDINNVPDENVSPTEEDDQSTQADHSDSDTQEEADTSTVEDSDEGTEQATEDSELEATDEPSTQESADSNGVIYDFDGDTEQAPDDLVLELMDAPSNLTPVPDSTLEGEPPVISWDHVPGAVGYKVRIFDAWEDTVFGSPFLTDTAFSVPKGALSPDTAYGYRVYAYKERFKAENDALPSANEDFDGDTEQAPDDLVLELMDAPSNLTPVPDSTLEGDPPVISWDHVPGAVGYKVRIFDAWEDTVFGSPFLTDSAFSVPQGALSPDATYRYRVYAYKEPFEAENYALMPADASKIDLMLNIAAVDDNGNNIDPETIAHEWLYIAATIRGVDLGIFFYTKDGLKNLETVLVEDPSFISATYDFDHSASDTFSFGKISLKNDLGMVSGDVLIYGYCYTLTDVSEIRVENIVTLNVQ